ncbi:MAG: adenylate/guanylate cyclase domain-containing protein [Methylococcales bacterium]|nr:adenylate/guanylate cyclase domain-containing protein [Methylococcales bacterium]
MMNSNKLLKIFRQLCGLFLIFIVSAHTSHQIEISLITRMEYVAYDLRMIATLPNTIDPRIVIIDIDEKSLQAEGRWPWSRNKLAFLVNIAFDYYKIRLMAFDMVFAEKDTSSGLWLLDAIAHNGPTFQAAAEQLRSELSYDAIFADSFKGKNIVLGYFASFQTAPVNETTQLPKPVAQAEKPFAALLLQAQSYGANLTQLQNAAASAGFFNNFGADRDGVSRRLPLLFQYQHGIYESLSLAVIRQLHNASPLKFTTDDLYGTDEAGERLEQLQIKSFSIPVDEKAAVLIPYRGKQKSFRYISATDVLNGVVKTSELENKIVLVGTSAAGLFDLRSTPIQKNYPGVEIHANIISGILDKTIKSRPNYILICEVFLLMFIGAFIMLLIPRLSVIYATIVFILLVSFIVGLNFYLWTIQNIDSQLASPLLLLFSLFGLQLFFGYFFESRRKKQLRTLFGQYIPPELVEQMNQSEDTFSLQGESKALTVFFSDIRGFTTISESLAPQALCDLINDILTPITQTIHQNQGTIDKYIGDAVMAFWGAPLADKNHAQHAVQAGLEVLENLEKRQAKYRESGQPNIELGIGINTGVMNVGNMGSQFRTAYTVMGDAVNLGARLEGLTKYYGVKFIVSESTQKAAPDYIYRELDKVQVKGKTEPVTIYEVVGHRNKVSPDYLSYLELLQQALFYYYRQNWLQSTQIFSQLQRQQPDNRLHFLYLERIEAFKQQPPAKDWDGTFIHHSK